MHGQKDLTERRVDRTAEPFQLRRQGIRRKRDVGGKDPSRKKVGTDGTEELLGVIAINKDRGRVREIRDDHIECPAFPLKKIPRVGSPLLYPGIPKNRLEILRQESAGDL